MSRHLLMQKNCRSILIILRRYRGDVLLALPLLSTLKKEFEGVNIDLLVNPETESTAQLLPHVRKIHIMREYYKWNNRLLRFWRVFILLIRFFRKYDIAINLTTNDAGALLSWAAGSISISVCETEKYKSWWKKILVTHTYYYDKSAHTVIQSLKSLHFLKIHQENQRFEKLSSQLKTLSTSPLVKEFQEAHPTYFIFHPSTQFAYKMLPRIVKNELLLGLTQFRIPIVVTGGHSTIDREMAQDLPQHPLIMDFISKITLNDVANLTAGCCAYIGMDTFNMHLAALYEKRIFAFFGPTLPQMWAPWNKEFHETNFMEKKTIYHYGNVSLFQADVPCVPCDRQGCHGSGVSECLSFIDPKIVLAEIKKWLSSFDQLSIQRVNVPSQSRDIVSV